MSLVLIFLYLYSVNTSLFILSSGKYIECDTIPFNYSPNILNNITAPVIFNKACEVSNVSNSIVITSWETDCSYSEKVTNMQKGGAIAVIFSQNGLPGSAARSNEMPKLQITIPVLSAQKDCIVSLMNTENITGFIEDTPNHWLTIYDNVGYYFGQCIIGIMSCLLIIISSMGAAQNFYENRVITTKLVVLIFEALLHIFVLLSVIDLGNSRGIYSQNIYSHIFRTSVYLLAMSNLLMGFYFLEIFSDQMTGQDSFLRVYKLPFIIVTFIIILIIFIVGLIASEYLINLTLTNTISGPILVILILFSLVILIAVLWKCYQIANIKGYLKKIRSVVFNFVVVCVIITVLVVILQLLFATTIYHTTYYTRIISQFLICSIGQVGLSSFKIYKMVVVQNIKQKFKSKSKSTSSKYNKNTTEEPRDQERTEEKVNGKTEEELKDIVSY